MNERPPRRKVVRIERVYHEEYNLKFTLECGHTQIRTKHQECATIACLVCQHEKDRQNKA